MSATAGPNGKAVCNMPTLTWTPELTPKHKGPTDKIDWSKEIGNNPWCGCGKRIKGFAWIYEQAIFMCDRCGQDCGRYSSRCKTPHCTKGVTVCHDCLTNQQAPRSGRSGEW
jgi:hypothetical protein